MLRFLSIQNLAVIEALEIEFAPGLTVLTGETGAGKSILVEAIGLLVGERATPDLIRTGADATVVQAAFETGDGEELVIRREVTAAGRSRAFVGGALATTAGLREIGRRLVDLHGQHEHQALLNPESHLDVLDVHAGLGAERAGVASAFNELRRLAEALRQAQAEEAQRSARAELAAFQLGEIERVQPREGEDEELAATRRVLASAERVKTLCEESYASLYESDGAALASLSRVWKKVEELAALEPKFRPHLEARASILPQLDDLARSLRAYGAAIDLSPAHLQAVEDRLAALERLKRKHGPALTDVLAKHDRLKAELASLETVTERISTLSAERDTARTTFADLARALSRARRDGAVRFARALERQLADLAMERCRFEVRFDGVELPENRWTARGIDEAEFYVAPNPGEDPRPLARIVSGGELSRVMLALKTLASTDQPGKSLVFDEVDAGIGGRVADAVGGKLRTLADRFQILCITHLPQIAAYGQAHVHIAKRIRHGRTVTEVGQLDAKGRVEELARMLAGAAVSDRTRATAREMLSSGMAGAPGGPAAKGESERAKARGLPRHGGSVR